MKFVFALVLTLAALIFAGNFIPSAPDYQQYTAQAGVFPVSGTLAQNNPTPPRVNDPQVFPNDPTPPRVNDPSPSRVNEPPSGLRNPLGNITFTGFINLLLDLIVRIATPVIILMIIFTGFKFVIAQGNSEKLNEAKRMFLWTMVGAMVIFGARAIIALVTGTVDVIK